MGLILAMAALFAAMMAVVLVPIAAAVQEGSGTRSRGGSMAED